MKKAPTSVDAFSQIRWYHTSIKLPCETGKTTSIIVPSPILLFILILPLYLSIIL